MKADFPRVHESQLGFRLRESMCLGECETVDNSIVRGLGGQGSPKQDGGVGTIFVLESPFLIITGHALTPIPTVMV